MGHQVGFARFVCGAADRQGDCEEHPAAWAGSLLPAPTPKRRSPSSKKLREQGLAFTISLLGEAVVSEAEAEDYSRRYLELLESLHTAQQDWPALGGDSNRHDAGGLDWGCTPKINLSIKPTAMYSQMNARAFEHSVAMAKERLAADFPRAVELGAFVNLDIEHRAVKNLSLALVSKLDGGAGVSRLPHTGLALQAYLRDTGDDLRGVDRLEPAAGSARYGAAGQGRLLGCRGDLGAAEKLAGSGVHQQA